MPKDYKREPDGSYRMTWVVPKRLADCLIGIADTSGMNLSEWLRGRLMDEFGIEEEAPTPLAPEVWAKQQRPARQRPRQLAT